ncbi:MAG: ABC transporter substrate-binding protein [Cardiobacteriaceae bacterium]|nr:ABC transporter substrate-binding protein [Cardiobacteriaceae bacterium]
MKKILLALAFIGQCFLSALAAPSPESARELVERQAQTILDNLSKNKALYSQNPDALIQLADQEILPHLDFSYMAKFVLGRSAKQVTADKQSAFEQAFKQFLVRAYSKGWEAYADSKLNDNVKFLGNPDVDDKGRAVLKLQVRDKTGNTVPVEFKLRPSQEKWLIYDVVFANVSFLISYRSSFENILQNQGVDSLIQQLNQGSIQP